MSSESQLPPTVWVVIEQHHEDASVQGVYGDQDIANEVARIGGYDWRAESFQLGHIPGDVQKRVMEDVVRLRKLVPDA